jgi:hypothetical protein
MRFQKLMKTVVFITSMAMVAGLAIAAPLDSKDKDDDGNTSGKAPSVKGWMESGSNTDYKPKSDSDGATWTFDPAKVDLNGGTSDSGTNFQGARILKGEEDVVLMGTNAAGVYDDTDNSRYSYWEGSTLYFGAKNKDTLNSVDGIAEVYWFESSIPRGSDFYVIQLKVKSSPNPWDNWILAKEPSFIDEYIFFWNDVQPAQHVDVEMEEGGAHGSLRWDFCVPFETYKWEPVKVMQIHESYGAGYSVEGKGNIKGNVGANYKEGFKEQEEGSFKEGGIVADASADATIQAKGYVNSSFKVQSQYTITLYKWQMLVQSGGQDIHYKMVVLPHEDKPDSDSDSGYYEYFIVIQAKRGTPVHIKNIEIGGMFRHQIPFWFDTYDGVALSISDLWITPPHGVCLPGDLAPPDACSNVGVCGLVEPQCVDNMWVCPVMDVYESKIEHMCDGLDNNCDGVVDENINRECSTACGTGYEYCEDGKFLGCDAPKPTAEICGDGVDNDCDGEIDNGCHTDPPPTENPPANQPDPSKTAANTPDPNYSGNNGFGNNSGQSYQQTNNKSQNTPVPNAEAAACTAAQGTPVNTGLWLLGLALLGLGLVRRRQFLL